MPRPYLNSESPWLLALLAALVALGYKSADAGKRVQTVPENLDSVEAIIRHALQAAGK